MPHTLTGLIPDAYAAMHQVGRELSGFIPACTLSSELARAAVGQSVTIPIAPASTGEDITPASTPPNTGAQVMSYVQLSITKARAFPFQWTGEEERGLSFGPGRLTIQQQQIAQAMRAAVNEIETDLAIAAYKKASRAYGTAGTTPFASNINDLNQLRKILVDNGCPMNDLQYVMDTNAGVNMRNIATLQKVNESGDSGLLRQGILGNISGFDIRESAFVAQHTKGTENGAYDVNLLAGYAIGDRTIAVDTGTGTVLAGDVITFAGDTNKYVVNTALSGGSLTIGRPGLRQTLADGVNMDAVASYRANLAFHRSAVVAAIRPPALPKEGDSAIDRFMLTDPYTGITFEIAMYLEYRRVRYELAVAWGVGGVDSEFIAIHLG